MYWSYFGRPFSFNSLTDNYEVYDRNSPSNHNVLFY